MVMQASYESSQASIGLFQLISIHPPQIDEQICPGLEHLSNSMSRVGPSLTLCVQGWSMSESYFQGWNISYPPCPVVEHHDLFKQTVVPWFASLLSANRT